MRTPIALALLALTGCPDPTYAPAIDQDEPAVGAGAGSSPSGEAQQPGDPVVGNEPTVDASVTPGKGVVISGTLSYEGDKTGRIRLDVLTTKGRNPHVLAKTLELPEFGPWAVELPKDFGTVNVMAFLDQSGDGPTEDDPVTALAEPVVVGGDPIEGLDLTLQEGGDVRKLLNAEPPPEPPDDVPMPDADAPPEELPALGTPEGQPIEGGQGNPGGGPAGQHPNNGPEQAEPQPEAEPAAAGAPGAQP